MALNPCIENGDCIDLSIQPNSNLRADINLSEDVDNCLECRPNGLYAPCGNHASAFICNAIIELADGLWARQAFQSLSAAGPGAGPFDPIFNPYQEITLVGPFFPAGKQVVRTVQLNYTSALCGTGIVMAAMNAGPVQFSDISPGGRVTAGQQARTLPAPFAGGPYGLVKNPGGNFMDLAFPMLDSTVTIDPSPPITPGTIEWEQSYEVTAGSVGSITFRPVFLYVWSIMT